MTSPYEQVIIDLEAPSRSGTLVILLSASLGASAAQAEVIQDALGNAIGITNLDVGGVIYDVAFVLASGREGDGDHRETTPDLLNAISSQGSCGEVR